MSSKLARTRCRIVACLFLSVILSPFSYSRSSGTSGSGPSALPRSGLAESSSRTVSFLARGDHDEALANVAVSLGGEGARQSQCVTDASGHCSVSLPSSVLRTPVSFRLELSGYEAGTGSLSKSDIAGAAVLIVVHLRPSPQESQSAGGVAGQQPQPGQQQSLKPGEQTNGFSLEVLIGALAILLLVIAGTAWWTQYSVLRSFQSWGAELGGAVKGIGVRMLDDQLLPLVKEVRDEQKTLAAGFAALAKPFKQPNERQVDSEPRRTKSESAVPVEPHAPEEAKLKLCPSNEPEAQNAYRALLRDRTLLSSVLHVIREVSPSALDMLQQASVHLREVSRSQGSFVLFKDRDGKRGWVFPNPELLFRKEVLGPVFPNLDQATFENAKESIGSVNVVAAGDRRWKVVVR